ncbi:ABC transporter permease [Pseudobdellovibrio exovorus]|uniref:Peptide ABC transporter permease n=1 Tax=Pseudobdellovibrio exovorus JSS TaxID=1184267 RepID=M4V7A3_9BACT|nr:ABC transporter permease [Pseudobdellovibrio exovorus]AGH95078.1 peptide ABC transporter permease [Pseudobdellovibrio exovorus JSS]
MKQISWINLAWKSLKNRRFSTVLTVFSMVLSLVLLMSVERIKRAAQDGFTQSVSGVDLVVGARSGPLQIILYSVFNIGQATQNVSIESYNEIRQLPEVEWTIPYSLGDGHRGFRVVATNQDFFKYYKFRSQEHIELAAGRPFESYFDVVVGADVAKTLGYQVGSKVVVAHGVTTGIAIQEHDDKPFHVVGVMKPTGTPLDRALYIPLEGMEAIHLDWQTGSAPSEDQQIKVDQITAEMVQPKTITSFFLRTKNRIETLRLQRWINEYQAEPLTAVIPGVVLAEMWTSLSMVEKVLKGISFLVMLVGLISMLIAIMTALNERRREMAVLRALGASLKNILALILIETFILSSVAIILACGVKVLFEMLLGPWLQSNYGLYLQAPLFSVNELLYLALMLISSLLISFIPAIKAMRSALKDGLSVKL